MLTITNYGESILVHRALLRHSLGMFAFEEFCSRRIRRTSYWDDVHGDNWYTWE